MRVLNLPAAKVTLRLQRREFARSTAAAPDDRRGSACWGFDAGTLRIADKVIIDPRAGLCEEVVKIEFQRLCILGLEACIFFVQQERHLSASISIDRSGISKSR